MAKDKVEIEILPKFAADALEKTKGFFADSFSSGMAKAKLLAGGAAGLAALGTAPIGMAKGAEALLGAFTNAFNPAVMQQFSLAINDTVAVIGEMLVPVVEALVPLIRTWGDFLASILPSQKEMADLMKELNPLFNEMRNLLAVIAPHLRVFFSLALIELAKSFKEVSVVMMDIMRGMAGIWADLIVKFNALMQGSAGNMELARRLYEFSITQPGTGKDLNFGKFSGSSVGKAAGGATSMGFEGLSEKLVMASMGMGRTTAEEQLAWQKENVQAVRDLEKKAEEIGQQLGQFLFPRLPGGNNR